MRRFGEALVVLVVVAGSTSACTVAKHYAATPAPRPAAVFKGGAILNSEVEAEGMARLFQIRNQEYQTRRQVLEEVLTRRLLELEAATLGIAVEAMLTVEVDEKVVPPTDAESRAQLAAAPERYARLVEGDALAKIADTISRQRIAERRRAFHADLRARWGVQILLEPPRLAADPDDDPAIGPAGAPVSIVAFSDYQCPHCARFADTLLRLAGAYQGKVRVVFRDFPLLTIHKEAGKAAEAAACAGEQGKFIEMSTEMFATQSDLKPASLKTRAAALGLDVAAFAACLDGSRYAAEWQKDLEDGRRYGISGTPVAFVNGRYVSGARSYEGMAQLVDEELALAARAAAAPAARPAHGH